jgi:acetolactate synthase-1/2/3 large subunit
MNAARTAVMGHRKVVVVCGDVVRGGPRGLDLKYVDHGPLAAAIDMEFFPSVTASDARDALRRAYIAADAGRPALVSIALDVLHGPRAGVRASGSKVVDPVGHIADPTPAQVAEIVSLLNASRRPLFLAGRGAVIGDARELLVELAEQTGALLGTSLEAKDLFRGTRLDVGVIGGFASDPAVPLLALVDCVLVFGASLNRYTTAEATLFRDANVVHIDVDPNKIGANVPVRLGVVADAAASARSVLEALGDAKPSVKWSDELADSLTGPLYAGYEEGGSELDPRILAMELDRLLPPEVDRS